MGSQKKGGMKEEEEEEAYGRNVPFYCTVHCAHISTLKRAIVHSLFFSGTSMYVWDGVIIAFNCRHVFPIPLMGWITSSILYVRIPLQHIRTVNFCVHT